MINFIKRVIYENVDAVLIPAPSHKKDYQCFGIDSGSIYYGIDVNCLQRRFGYLTRYAGEQEVLFPLDKELIVKEYGGTPNKFKYYLRKYL